MIYTLVSPQDLFTPVQQPIPLQIYPRPATNHPQNLPQNLNLIIRERQSHHIKKKLVLYDHFWIRKTMKFRVWNKKIWKK